MNLLKRAALLTGASLAVLCITASPLALAHGGHDHDDNSTATDASTTAAKSDDSNSDSTLRERAKQLLDDRRDKRQDRKEKNEAQRQQVCENHQKAINLKLSNLGNRADRHLKAFDALFTKVKAYQDKNKLDVTNYDDLVADVTAKQAAATTAVANLKGNAGTINCGSGDVLSTLAVDKTTGDQARTALQAYRSSLKTLIDALINAKTTGDN
jgi:hypothetical protein